MDKLINMLKSTIKKWGLGGTLTLQEPNGRVFFLVIFMLIGYVLLGELVFSQNVVQSRLMGPRIGSRHRQFEVQWARLEKLVKDGERIDCIFLGNSMIWIDVNPLVVSQTFEYLTGQGMRCFNFGVSALPASSAGLIAPILVERYHPKFLIYGTYARDYAIPASAEDATAVSETPWLKYQSGSLNPVGWLYDHSSFFQYKSYMPELLFLNFGDVFPGYNGFPPYHEYGFDPKLDIQIDVRNHPDFDHILDKDPQKWLYHYRLFDENLRGLNQIVHQSENGVEVIVVEMPFYPRAFEFFSNGEEDYNQYVEQVNQITTVSGTRFWRLADQPDIPEEDWWDYFHMNIHGAQVFSEWLGNELGKVVLQEAENPVSLEK